MDPEEFMQEPSEQTWLRKWIAKQHALQMAHTETVGWILYSISSMNIEFWTSKVNEWIAKHFPKETIPIGLEHRAIFDGAGKDARQKMSKDEKWAKHGLHVLCKHGV